MARHVRTTFWLAALLVLLPFLPAVVRPGVAQGQTAPPPDAPPPSQDDPKPAPAKPLNTREARDQTKMMEDAAEAVRINNLARINGVPYDRPSAGDTFRAYARDTYGWPALVSTTVRSLYGQARGKPTTWDYPERFGSAAGITIINGNVRYGLATLFHEDLRYLPCHRCSKKLKLENALLAEVTARHSDDGHRFFTLTPTVADFSGPIIAHSLWYPNGVDPLQGVIAARTVFATRIGGHLIQEFILDKLHPSLKPQN